MEYQRTEKMNNRITVALDNKTLKILNELKKNTTTSQSELLRKSIRFFYDFRKLINEHNNVSEKFTTYLELLSNGEHIILDIDHYLLFLKFIEDSPNKEEFWEVHKAIAKGHAHEFAEDKNISTVQNIINRMEACNFFKVVKDSSTRYTLLLGTDIQKTFIKILLEEIFNGLGIIMEIQEGLSKLKVSFDRFLFKE